MKGEGDGPLGGKGEAEWARLARTIQLASGFWLGFVFSPSAEDALVLRRRAAALLSGHERSLSAILCDRPESLLEALPALLVDPALAAAGCVWIEAVYADPPGARGGPWTKGWIELFLRANERRDLLRRRLTGGLVFAATPRIKPSVREAAPDLWSVRTLVLELDPVPSASPEPRTWTPPLLRATRDKLAPDPAFALAEAERRAAQRDDVSRGIALVQAASGFLAEGLVALAKAAAQQARDLLHEGSPLDESSALALLARAEVAEGSVLPAADHIAAAISIRVDRGPLAVPIEWHDLSATIALLMREPSRAQASYERAITAARERATSVDSAEALRDLAVLLERRAAMERDVLVLAAARADLEEAVKLRRCQELTDDHRAMHEFAGTLNGLAEVYKKMGEGALAYSASREAAGLRERSVTPALEDTLEDYRELLRRLVPYWRFIAELPEAKEKGEGLTAAKLDKALIGKWVDFEFAAFMIDRLAADAPAANGKLDRLLDSWDADIDAPTVIESEEDKMAHAWALELARLGAESAPFTDPSEDNADA